jgi:hypothetical protein
MYWYNLKPAVRRGGGSFVRRGGVNMLAGDPNSAEFVQEYLKLRHSGAPIEQALYRGPRVPFEAARVPDGAR